MVVVGIVRNLVNVDRLRVCCATLCCLIRGEKADVVRCIRVVVAKSENNMIQILDITVSLAKRFLKSQHRISKKRGNETMIE